jgi:6-phosphogluconolactonase
MKHTSILLGLFTAVSLIACQKEIQNRSESNANSNESNALSAANDAGDVYTESNSRDDNRIFHYDRASNGTLTLEGKYSTNGKGTGLALGSQGAVILSEDKNWLFAVNAGSNEISVFRVNSAGHLELADKVSSRGVAPISIAVHGSLLYVLNAGAGFKGSIAGFHISSTGKLSYIENSKRALSNIAVEPAQISFKNNGTALVVTEKATSKIVTFTVDANGLPGSKQVTASAGITPFGFAVGQLGNIYVSEAFNGLVGKSTVSSYHVSNNGNITVLDALVHNHQTAACWVVVTHDYKYIYAANTGSNTITAYVINSTGDLSLLNADGVTATTGLAPADEALSNDSRYLYVLNGGDKTIGSYYVADNGSLTKIDGDGDLHPKSAGLAAR